MIGLTLYHKGEECVTDPCDVEAALLNFDIPVEILFEWPEGIVDLGIITK